MAPVARSSTSRFCHACASGYAIRPSQRACNVGSVDVGADSPIRVAATLAR